MKNNLCKIEKRPNSILLNSKGSIYAMGLLAGLFGCQEMQAQEKIFVNKGDLKITDKTIVSVLMDYDNEATGNFDNDGDLYIYKNWNNDGIVSFTKDNKSGRTSFLGSELQQISGSGLKPAGFQNIVFDNTGVLAPSDRSLMPFDLKTAIEVGNNADFKIGIINAAEYDGKIIFDEEAQYSNAGDLSFVDGMVQKKGMVQKPGGKQQEENNKFEFPVGNNYYYRPAIAGASTSVKEAYTIQYYFKDSNGSYPHDQRDPAIKTINDAEYWNVTKAKENSDDKIVLTLTLNDKTTPSSFLNVPEGKKLAIVRWDKTLNEWVNCKGEVSDPAQTTNYEKLLTAQVSGDGIFTMALIDKDVIDEKLVVYNAVSPNGDGINDAFHILGIDKYPDNIVEIYNRWGVKVYDAKSYNESDNMFRGYSDGRATINRNEKLPTGTYFYILKYNNTKKVVEQSGYLYINNQ